MVKRLATEDPFFWRLEHIECSHFLYQRVGKCIQFPYSFPNILLVMGNTKQNSTWRTVIPCNIPKDRILTPQTSTCYLFNAHYHSQPHCSPFFHSVNRSHYKKISFWGQYILSLKIWISYAKTFHDKKYFVSCSSKP